MSTDARAYEYGRIVSVDVVELGDNLDADAAIGATSITVEDAADFDEDGGQLILNGVVYTYTACDDDTGIITGLAPALAAAAVEGDSVSAYDPLYAAASTDKVAQVQVRGDDGNVDTLECQIAEHLIDRLDEGIRGGRGEAVKLELDGDGTWVVVDLQGMGDPNSSGTLAAQDEFTVTAVGDQTLTLTYEPNPNSEHVYWEPAGGAGVYLPGSEWTRDGQAITVPDPDSIVAVDDRFTVEYLYRKGVETPAPTLGSLNLRGTASATGVFSSIALPTGTQIGDLIVVSAAERWYTGTLAASDSRLTTVYSQPQSGDGMSMFLVGVATTLAPIALSSNLAAAVAVATYVGGATINGSGHVGAFETLPQMSTNVAVVGGASSIQTTPWSASSTVFTVPAPWVLDLNVIDSGGFTAAAIFRWEGAGPSPASSVSGAGSSMNVFTVAGLQ